jgi:uncharacterized membrane protein YoaK (UPF0700 family)
MSAVPIPPAAAPTLASLRHPLTRALLLLTLTTGLVDAATYLGLGHVFAANMTGNIVLLGFGIAGAGGLPVVAPIVSLAAFLAGAGAGGRLARSLGQHRRRHLLVALIAEALLVVVAAIWTAAVDVRAGAASGDVVIGLLALGMGVRNATVRAFHAPDLTTTVLTLTLTGLAADSPPAGGDGSGTVRRTSAVVAMLAGAVLGALLLKTSLVLVLVCAAVLAGASIALYATLGGSD